MKHLFILPLLCFLALQGFAQKHLKLGVAYVADNISSPGLLIEGEYERFFSKSFSLPLRADLGFLLTPDYNAVTLEVFTGSRQYLPSGLFFEQSLGLGLMGSFYKLDELWYVDRYENVLIPYEGLNLGLMPSAALGLGYNLTQEKGTQNLIWIRPKVYWNLGVRGLNLPYSAIQIGFTHNLK